MLVAIFVDDLLIGCADKTQVEAVKKLLSNKFPVTDNGPLHHYLGIEIEREGETGAITICHSQYILEMLKEYGMENSKATATPLEANYQVVCHETDCKKVDQYQSAIGALIHVQTSCIPFQNSHKETATSTRTHAGCKANLQIS